MLRYSRFSGTYRDILENVFLHGDGGTEESIIGAGEEAKDIAADLIKMTVPTLFGGKAVPTSKDEMFGEKRTEKVELSELFDGDILLAIGKDVIKVFVYNGRALLDLSESFAEHPTDITFERLLAWDGVYVVLRPSAEIFK